MRGANRWGGGESGKWEVGGGKWEVGIGMEVEFLGEWGMEGGESGVGAGE